MTILHDGEPIDYEKDIKPLIHWLKNAAWCATDDNDKISASNAIVEIWVWAEELINDDSSERERTLSESLKESGEPSDFELFKEALSKGGLRPAERKMMQQRVRATEDFRARRARLTVALAAKTKLPVDYHNPGKKDYFSVKFLMGTNDADKAHGDFHAFLRDHFPDTPPEDLMQRFLKTYVQQSAEGNQTWNPGSFKSVRAAVVAWREKRRVAANQANASKPPAEGKKRGRPRKQG